MMISDSLNGRPYFSQINDAPSASQHRNIATITIVNHQSHTSHQGARSYFPLAGESRPPILSPIASHRQRVGNEPSTTLKNRQYSSVFRAVLLGLIIIYRVIISVRLAHNAFVMLSYRWRLIVGTQPIETKHQWKKYDRFIGEIILLTHTEYELLLQTAPQKSGAQMWGSAILRHTQLGYHYE